MGIWFKKSFAKKNKQISCDMKNMKYYNKIQGRQYMSLFFLNKLTINYRTNRVHIMVKRKINE